MKRLPEIADSKAVAVITKMARDLGLDVYRDQRGNCKLKGYSSELPPSLESAIQETLSEGSYEIYDIYMSSSSLGRVVRIRIR